MTLRNNYRVLSESPRNSLREDLKLLYSRELLKDIENLHEEDKYPPEENEYFRDDVMEVLEELGSDVDSIQEMLAKRKPDNKAIINLGIYGGAIKASILIGLINSVMCEIGKE